MWDTIPTVYNSLGVKISPYGARGLMFNGSTDCLVTLSLSLAIEWEWKVYYFFLFFEKIVCNFWNREKRSVSEPVGIHLVQIRIRIQHFRLNTDPDLDPRSSGSTRVRSRRRTRNRTRYGTVSERGNYKFCSYFSRRPEQRYRSEWGGGGEIKF